MKFNKGFTQIEIIVAVVVLAVLAVFSIPFFTPATQKQEATVRANVSIAASSITAKLSLKRTYLPTEASKISAEMLNKTTKNPIDKKAPAFLMNSVSVGAVEFIPDDKNNKVTINGYAEDLTAPLITKVIQVPSKL